MDRERWMQVKQIVNACLDLEPDRREAHFVAACGGDTSLLAEVKSLLDSCNELGDFLKVPFLEQEHEEILTGRQFGSYTLCEPVAEGGMGVVYRAVRANDFQKQVAIKVVKRGMDSDFILRRFRQERQILAGLDHPNIARLLDGGASPDGRPYLVMEYIEGIPITEYADQHKLGISARLEMFRTVCSGVQCAHQNLVVHRDLKPSNILVTAEGSPKLLDFGIAKLLEPEADATMTSHRLMTPEFASPEQARGLPITTATDIYSLGILLYILLTGERPYELTTRTPEEIARIVCEAEPRKPSAVRPLSQDLDNIVLKAIHKDPARRYLWAEQFSEDIRRYLAGLPVIARKDTLAYRSSKFVRRHAGASIAAGLAVISLLGGMAATLWQAHRSAVQQQIASAVNDFLRNDLLAQAGASKQAGPDKQPDPDLKVRTALDRAAAGIEGKFKAQPQVEASIRQTVGDAYEDLGSYAEAQRQVQRAYELRRRTLGEKHPDTLASMYSLAELYGELGKYAEAEVLQSKVLDLRRRVLGEEHPETLASMSSLGNIYKNLGKYAPAEAIQSKALELRRRALGEEHPDTLVSMNDLATLYEDQGKFAQAELLYARANEIRRRVLGEEHPYTLIGMNNLASVYARQGRFAEAEALESKVLELRRRVLGEEHPLTLVSMNNLAVEYTSQGKYGQAEHLLNAVLEIRRRLLGEENRDTLVSMNNLAVIYRRQGKYAQAEPLFREALEIQRRTQGNEHPYTLISMNNLAGLYQAERKYRQAEPLYVKALEGRRHILGSEHPDTLRTLNNLAALYVDEAKYTQAEARAREALLMYEKTNSITWERYYSQSLLGASLAGQKKYSEAESLLLAGYQGMAQREASIPAGNRSSVERAGRWIVQLYQDRKDPDRAAEWSQRLQKTQPVVRPR